MAQSEILLGALPYGADVVVGEELEIGTITWNGHTYTRYLKVIDVGILPNNTTKTVNHNIVGISGYLHISGIAFSSTGVGQTLPLVMAGSNNTIGDQIRIQGTTSSVLISTAQDWSGLEGLVYLEYYK